MISPGLKHQYTFTAVISSAAHQGAGWGAHKYGGQGGGEVLPSSDAAENGKLLVIDTLKMFLVTLRPSKMCWWQATAGSRRCGDVSSASPGPGPYLRHVAVKQMGCFHQMKEPPFDWAFQLQLQQQQQRWGQAVTRACIPLLITLTVSRSTHHIYHHSLEMSPLWGWLKIYIE